MDDEPLTRMAVEEIIREFGEKKQPAHPQECKINPLGKANKRFLGRTLHSMITHNKREHDRKHRKCQEKLKDLEHRRRKRMQRNYSNTRKEDSRERRRNESESSHEVFSSSESNGSSSRDKPRKKSKKSKRKKEKKSNSKKKHKQRGSSSSESETYNNDCPEYEDGNGEFFEVLDGSGNFYIDPSGAHNMVLAAATYNHVNQYLHYQGMLGKTSSNKFDKELAEFEANELNDLESLPTVSTVKPENISLLETTSSSSSETDKDENGIMTIDLSTDDDKKIHDKQKTAKIEISSSDCDAQKCEDEESNESDSCISLNSSTKIGNNIDETEVLSICSSEPDADNPDKITTGEIQSKLDEKSFPPVNNCHKIRISEEAIDLTAD